MYKEKYPTGIQISRLPQTECIESQKSQNIAPTERSQIGFLKNTNKFCQETVEKQDCLGDLTEKIIIDAHASIRPIDNMLSKLTRRQLQIIILIAAGKSRKAIAKELSLSENTIKAHAQTAYRILGVSSRSAIASLLDPLNRY